jgi:hypothetical protein
MDERRSRSPIPTPQSCHQDGSGFGAEGARDTAKVRRVRTDGAVTSLNGLRDSRLVFDPLRSRTLRTRTDGGILGLVRSCASARSVEAIRCLLVRRRRSTVEEPVATASRLQHVGMYRVVDNLQPRVDGCRGARIPVAQDLTERIAGIDHCGGPVDQDVVAVAELNRVLTQPARDQAKKGGRSAFIRYPSVAALADASTTPGRGELLTALVGLASTRPAARYSVPQWLDAPAESGSLTR